MYHWVMILATVGVPAKYKENSKKTVGRCELREKKKEPL